jgi:transcriptional regulator with XRE-family HTH domain
MLVRLKLVLLERGLTQTRLARAIGISQASLSRLIRGRVRCRARLRRLISEELGLRQAQIFDSDQTSKRKKSLSRVSSSGRSAKE